MIDYMMGPFVELSVTSLAGSLLAGALLGLFYFAGLWWTVRQLGSSQHVALLFLCSMLVRTGIVVVGFYFILGDSWPGLVAGLLGFIVIRTLATRWAATIEPIEPSEERSHHAS